MRGESQSTRWSKLRTGLHSWTKRSSKTVGQLSDDMKSAEISADKLSNESTTPRKQSRSVKLYFVFDHVVHYQSLGSHRQCSAWLADALSSVFPKNNAKLVVMMQEVLAFPLDTNDVVNSLETMELKIMEFERCENIQIPEFFNVGSTRGTDEDAPHHEVAQVDDFQGHQDRGDERQAIPECGDGKDGSRNGRGCRPKVLPKGNDSEVVCWYCEKKFHRASECRKKQKDLDKGHSKVRSRATAKKRQQEGIQGQVLHVPQDGSHEAKLQVQRSECIRSERRRLGGNRVHRDGEHRLECAGDPSGAVAGGRPQDSYWDRLVCGSDCVEDGGGRLPDAPNTRQTKELQASVRQASAGPWCVKGAGQTQRQVYSIREPESGGHAQSFDGGVGDEPHGSPRVIHQE